MMLYPLRFQPLFKRYLWGGRRLGTVLNKPIEGGDDYAESWELVDHGSDQSVVANGPLSGKTLAELVHSHGRDLLGRHAPLPRFPLLFKFLDCNRALSVQVHPNDEQAKQLDPPDLGKTEAWVILAAEPGSVIYAGLKRGIDRAALEREVHRGTTEPCLHKFEPKVGDCVFIPAGTVHALGAGLVVAEIQQASDTTFRLFDWNRVGPDGKPRQLHVRESLDVIDYSAGPVSPQVPRPTERPYVQRLVECDKFILDRWTISRRAGSQPVALASGGRKPPDGTVRMPDSSEGLRPPLADDRFHILAVLDGEIRLSGDPSGEPLRKGQTALIPACLTESVEVADESVLLDAYLP
ncbi:MAG TPA: type I phosphomannose isomerase catalytic subunit [Pirellulaceae bacterium]|nr:type I phosphomannose isomerase catalytic subunit [Pirellulaceae bacterium]